MKKKPSAPYRPPTVDELVAGVRLMDMYLDGIEAETGTRTRPLQPRLSIGAAVRYVDTPALGTVTALRLPEAPGRPGAQLKESNGRFLRHEYTVRWHRHADRAPDKEWFSEEELPKFRLQAIDFPLTELNEIAEGKK